MLRHEYCHRLPYHAVSRYSHYHFRLPAPATPRFFTTDTDVVNEERGEEAQVREVQRAAAE